MCVDYVAGWSPLGSDRLWGPVCAILAVRIVSPLLVALGVFRFFFGFVNIVFAHQFLFY